MLTPRQYVCVPVLTDHLNVCVPVAMLTPRQYVCVPVLTDLNVCVPVAMLTPRLYVCVPVLTDHLNVCVPVAMLTPRLYVCAQSAWVTLFRLGDEIPFFEKDPRRKIRFLKIGTSKFF